MEYKYSLPIPVPIGTNVYEVVTTCGDYCYQNKELFNSIWPPTKEGHCDRYMPCHTKLHSIREYPLTLGNLEHVLKHFSKTIFDTYEEAEMMAEKFIVDHRVEMVLKGFDVKEDGRHFEIKKEKIK